jgi:cell division protein FtsN
VQVGAFRDRDQAETVRKPLAAAGLDTYVTAVPADGGQMRYKVRVGSFKTREDATRMADRLRQERSLSAFVTGR